MLLNSQPIVAIATAPGRGGIGVVRVSGPHLGPFIFKLLGKNLTPRHAHYLPFHDENAVAIDHGIALYFQNPNSYTGEDILELQGHGGPAVMQQLLRRCLAVGTEFDLRLADPGEFTQRAFLNNKIDLAQAEAVADLIDATSEAAARAAASSLSGIFSERINLLATSIVQLRLLVEATLDFPEEEIEFLEKYQARSKLNSIRLDLDQIIAQSRQGLVLREGLHVVLAGEPNVGKSSLLNALAGEDLAIVTDIAGTTRDKVTQIIHIEGVPITIIDTAGLRDTSDLIESIGISRSWNEIKKADVILHLMDATKPTSHLDDKIDSTRSRQSIVLSVMNKIDLLDKTATLPKEAIGISARTGLGLNHLKKKLLEIAGWNPGQESPWLARQRHVDALEQARMHLSLAHEHAAESDRVLDLFAEELRLAHDALGNITGRMTPDDLLGEIFSRFCIGK
ncbi:tRNA uridine-5-carboxymethylaminomethyl(34) synthesis GTPase MnmE [Orrella sp. NBD-18]|uniref:tRNA modification GTPase MnmE n=1 Tax=Sheuella amnicola TaxID=2707330 RepID=A0A6B2QWB4_9BURK|nr:tRNA uridine-5-carboxymethylaminomethyl(34) synthesis GTPase MnmE [Sheuella amnicola]NDY82431.1 tRNA uridine-5-carboxymethylaminomethyl(34) synthesis GTPase MnmE [Sheuella amnicola]